MMPRLFLFGLGYTGQRIAALFAQQGWEIVSTGSAGTLSFDDEATVRLALADARHVLSSVPPAGDGSDPVLARFGDALAGRALYYLSSTGVYGDCGGAWVDESAPIGSGRRTARVEAERGWLALGARTLRLPGIYGPGRSALDRVLAGRAHRLDLPQQCFSRIHVEDIARGVWAARDAPPGAYNLADDCPASQNAVVEEACRLLGLPPPALVSLDAAALSPVARGFYAENRRIANGKAKRMLGWRPLYPSYREGLAALWSAGQREHEAGKRDTRAPSSERAPAIGFEQGG